MSADFYKVFEKSIKAHSEEEERVNNLAKWGKITMAHV